MYKRVAIKRARTIAHANVTNTFLESDAHSLTYDTRRYRYNQAPAISHVHRRAIQFQSIDLGLLKEIWRERERERERSTESWEKYNE